MKTGIVYYTDNRISGSDIYKLSQRTILASGLPIVSCSLFPIDFGFNVVLEGRERGYDTMVEQILTALKTQDTEYVFFCEHDVLYHPSHWDFMPPTKDLFYYNINNWRWLFPDDLLITYGGLTSLSMMCCDRELAIRHFQGRHDRIHEFELYKIKSKEPKWARRLGYEPGTKPRRRGGFSDEGHSVWRSTLPNIDIRHKYTFSSPKCKLEDFKHKPSDFIQSGIDDIPGWNLRKLFSL